MVVEVRSKYARRRKSAAEKVALERRMVLARMEAVAEHRWAPVELVDDYVMLGWMPWPGTLIGTPHGGYRMHVEWVCSCHRRAPVPVNAKSHA